MLREETEMILERKKAFVFYVSVHYYYKDKENANSFIRQYIQSNLLKDTPENTGWQGTP